MLLISKRKRGTHLCGYLFWPATMDRRLYKGLPFCTAGTGWRALICLVLLRLTGRDESAQVYAKPFGKSCAILGVCTVEIAYGTELDVGFDLAQVINQIAEQMSLLLLRKRTVQFAGLGEVIRFLDALANDMTAQRSFALMNGRIFHRARCIAVRLIVHRRRILIHVHQAIALMIAHRGIRAVDRDLQIIGAQTMTLRIRVRE